ncbi:PulJ/GspJ family protein [Ramlibacter sp. MMS24-I3-19]|uniref:PulJ/GspJ family protein n=1 Tax=Ramlibacter sp. MMS24-I3-19 TaxID=3416606 RepID=UPI003D03B9DA
MRRPQSGFTLVELLVALFALSLLAMLSWRGIDGMVKAREQTRVRADEVQALQVGLAQWAADLDALVTVPQMSAVDWNGRVFRLLREAPGDPARGVVVVGWSRRVDAAGSRWMRWQSPPALTRGQLDDAWRLADAWAQNSGTAAGADEVAITGLLDWQIFYYRSDAWTNPLSSDTTNTTTASTPLTTSGTPTPTVTRAAVTPDGIRIVLTLAPGQTISGDLTRDWVRPTVGGRRS